MLFSYLEGWNFVVHLLSQTRVNVYVCVCAYVFIVAWEACGAEHNDFSHFSIPQTQLRSRGTIQSCELLVDCLVSCPISKSCMLCHVQSLVSSRMSHPIVLCLVGLSVMDLELFDRWVYVSITPLLQTKMMMLQPIPHPHRPQQVGNHSNPFSSLHH